MIDPWRATCVQMPSEPARNADTRVDARKIMANNIAKAESMIDEAMNASPPPSLLVLPEFFVQGPPHGESVAEWVEKACYPIPGPLTEPLQAKAQQHGIYIGANQFEADPEWAGRYFNSSFLINPSGDIVLRYRRIHTAFWCSPHDLLDAYLERYGWDGLWPVVDTPLGRIGMLACGEIMVPEAVRVLMFQGAEILVHPTNEPIFEAGEASKVVAGATNMLYVLSANVSGLIGEPFNAEAFGAPPGTVYGGSSRIVDFRGRTLAYEQTTAATLDVTAMIDIDGLRAARATPSLGNSLARLRVESFRDIYAKHVVYRANRFLTTPMKHPRETGAAVDDSLHELRSLGVVSTNEEL